MRKQSLCLLCLFVLSTNCGRTGLETLDLAATDGGATATGGTTFLLTGDIMGGTSATGGSWTNPANTMSTGGTSSTGGAGAEFFATGVSAGSDHTCALLNNGTLQCWGDNYYGQLGDGTMYGHSWLPVAVVSVSAATAVSAGGSHTCAILGGGSIQCWGFNSKGQLGSDTPSHSSVPVTVSGIAKALAVAAGDYHTCAVLSSGTVQCWGWNQYGQLGNGTTADSFMPLTVSGITDAVVVTAGEGRTCTVLSGRTVQCWGDNYDGELGNGTTTNSLVPVTVSGITDAIGVAVGGSHTCALRSGGTVQCWGESGQGQLGYPAYDFTILVPAHVSGITDAVAIAAGADHTCALLGDKTVQCWGSNDSGQLGNGTTIPNSDLPVTVSGITDAVAVAAGDEHACAVLSSGTVRCWGSNDYGQLGNGTTTDSTVPVTVSGF